MFSAINLKRWPFHYAWMVMALSFLGLLVTFGVRSSFGAYITSWESDFSVHRTVIASISMLSFVVYAFSQPVAGKMIDRFGARIVLPSGLLLVGVSLLLSSMATRPWQLGILYGFGVSIGLASCSNVTATAVITHWFAAKRGFAMGLTLSGMAVGQLIIVPATLFLTRHYGWRVSMSSLALIALIVMTPLLVLLMRSKPEDAGLKPYGVKDTALDEIRLPDPAQARPAGKTAGSQLPATPMLAVTRERAFWMLTLPYFMCGFTDVGLIQTHLIPMAEGKGFPVSIIALTFSTIALFNILGTIGTGYLSDHFNRSRQLALIYVIRAVVFVFLLTIKTPWLLIPFAVVYGATEMASIAPTSSLCAHLFDKYSIGTIFGLVSLSHQLGGAFGSWVPGVLYDLTGSYTYVIEVAVVLLVAGALLVSRVRDPRHLMVGKPA